MLLKQGDFQKQQPAPSQSVTASGRSSGFSQGCHVHPFPSCQQDPEGKIRGFVVPNPAGDGQEVVRGLASHHHPQNSGKWIPCPFPCQGMGREVGEGKATLSRFYHPLISTRGETGAWFNSLHLHTRVLGPSSDLHLSRKPSPQAHPLPRTLSIAPSSSSSSSPSRRLQEHFPQTS